jgi:high affinity sulfate transporter 1
MGLYCYLLGGLGYAVMGSSRHLAVGPTSAISLLVGVTLMELNQSSNAPQLSMLASQTALLMAGAYLLAWMLRLSVLVNFISESVLTGFKAGAALVIAATQLPKLLAVPGGGDDFFERLARLWQQLGSTNLLTLLIGGAALAVLLAGEKWLPGKPWSLVVVLTSIVIVGLGGLERQGVPVVGPIPPGLPKLAWRGDELIAIPRDEVRQLVRLACACFLLSYIESISAARAFALKHRYAIDPRQELLGLGAASLLAGLWQGYPVAGGLSQSAVNERGGAKTPLSLVIASLGIAVVLVMLTSFFRTLPDAVLAVVVLVAVKGLIDVRELRHLWRVSRLDFAAAAIALLGVLLMGVLDGVVIAVLATVGMLLWRGSRPVVAILGKIPGTNRYSDLARHPENESIRGVLAFRVQSSLLYYNAGYVLETVQEYIRAQQGLKRVVCDLSNVPYIDVQGARMLGRLAEELHSAGIDFKIVEAHAPIRDLLRSEGLEQHTGSINRYVSLVDLTRDVETP